MQPRRGSDWDRDADIRSIHDTYASYARVGRARLWDEGNPGYSRLAGDLQRQFVSSLVTSLPAGTPNVLDLGCGDGSLAADVLVGDIAVDWVGVDLRPEAIEAARQEHPTLTFVTASADRLPFDSRSFDVVALRVLFSSLPSRSMEAAAAAEVRRVLRPGGWVAWLDLRYSNPRNAAVHGLSEARVATLFPGWKRELRAAGLLPPMARRLGAATGMLYPVLAGIPLFRSHLVGRLQRPILDS